MQKIIYFNRATKYTYNMEKVYFLSIQTHMRKQNTYIENVCTPAQTCSPCTYFFPSLQVFHKSKSVFVGWFFFRKQLSVLLAKDALNPHCSQYCNCTYFLVVVVVVAAFTILAIVILVLKCMHKSREIYFLVRMCFIYILNQSFVEKTNKDKLQYM